MAEVVQLPQGLLHASQLPVLVFRTYPLGQGTTHTPLESTTWVDRGQLKQLVALVTQVKQLELQL